MVGTNSTICHLIPQSDNMIFAFKQLNVFLELVSGTIQPAVEFSQRFINNINIWNSWMNTSTCIQFLLLITLNTFPNTISSLEVSNWNWFFNQHPLAVSLGHFSVVQMYPLHPDVILKHTECIFTKQFIFIKKKKNVVKILTCKDSNNLKQNWSSQDFHPWYYFPH